MCRLKYSKKKKNPQLILKIFILWVLMKLAKVLQVTSEHKKMTLGGFGRGNYTYKLKKSW